MLGDLKYALRLYMRTPGFTAIVVAAIALGIGTNTAVFSIVNAVILRPLHASDPERIVTFLSTSGEGTSSDASETKFNLWRQQADVFQHVSAYYTGSVNLTGVDQPQRATAMFVTADYFSLFGFPIARGRNFVSEEERSHGPSAVLVSDAFWKRGFGGDPGMIGKFV